MTTPDHTQHASEADHRGTVEWRDLMRIACAALAAAAVWLRLWEPLPHVSVIGVFGTMVGGWPIFDEAWMNIRQRRMTMELSMTIALVAALAIGESSLP
jgi:cation transport ATPase